MGTVFLSVSSAAKPKSELSQEELAAKEEEEFNVGPLSVLTQSVKNNTQVRFFFSFLFWGGRLGSFGCSFRGQDIVTEIFILLVPLTLQLFNSLIVFPLGSDQLSQQ